MDFTSKKGFLISIISFIRSPVPNHFMPLANRYISLKYNYWWAHPSSPLSSSEELYSFLFLAPKAISLDSHPCLSGKLYSFFNFLIKLSGALLHVKFLILCLSSFIDFLGSQLSLILSRFFQQPCLRSPMNRKLSS